jgi:hypothetical protein
VQPAAPILPIRGGESHVPASGVLRARLGAAHPAEAVRGAVAVAWWVMERARSAAPGGRFWWDTGVEPDVPFLVHAMGIPAAEARAGFAALAAAGLLLPAPPGGVRLDPDALVEHAALASIDWDAVRAALRTGGARIGPALAVLREVARRLPDGERDALARLSLEGLREETLYGKSAVAGAVAELLARDLLRRPPGAERQYQFALGARVRAGGQTTAAASSPAAGEIVLPVGAEVTLLGSALPLSAGARITLGAAVGHIHLDRDTEGREVVQIGSLRIRLP